MQRKSPQPKQNKTCAQCGKEFLIKVGRSYSSNSGLFFCSKQCHGKYRTAQKGTNAHCHFCGRAFYRSPSDLTRRKVANHYCSRECYDKARQDDLAAKRKPVGRGGVHPAQCEYCGVTFFIKPSILNTFRKKYCSRECKRQAQIKTGSHVPREYIKSRQPACQICGLSELEILEIHHRDGNPRNNKDNNLIVVCPNCHTRIHKGLIKV